MSEAAGREAERSEAGGSGSGMADPQLRRGARLAASAWLRALARSQRGAIAATILCGLVGGLAIIGQAALLAWLLHALAVEGQGLAALWHPVLALVALYLLRALCAWGSERLGIAVALRVKAQVRRRIRDQVARLGPVRLRGRHSAGLAGLMLEQTEALEGYFARYLPQMALAVLLPAAILAVAFSLDWIVGLLFLLTGPLVPVFMALIGMGAAALHERQFVALSRMSSHFLDRLRGLATIRILSRGEAEVAAIHAVAEDYRRRTMSVLRVAFVSSGVLEFFTAVSIGLVALYIGMNILGILDYGGTRHSLFTGMFLLLLAPEFFFPLRQLAAHYHDRAAALGAAEGIRVFLEEAAPPPGRSAPPPGPVSIAVADLHLRYEGGGRIALAGAGLRVAAGERVALVGPSGGGKSSLLAVLAGFVTPDAGQVTLSGVPLAELDLPAWHRRLAWIGQQAHVFHGTIAENIALGDPQPDEERLRDAALAAGVTDFAAALPDGLATLVGERGLGLSGGQAQRVALARALYRPADLYLLDEPTARLDAAMEARVIAALERVTSGRTVVVATHSPALAAFADRVVHVSAGLVRGDGGGGS